MSQKYFFLIFGISQSDPAMVFSVDRAKCFRRCRHGVYVHDHGASRGWPSWVVPVQAEIIITCAQNIRISVIWLPSNHLTKTLSDSSCMTLKKCWATPSVVLFYQSLWVWEKGLFLSKKSHILSHFSFVSQN